MRGEIRRALRDTRILFFLYVASFCVVLLFGPDFLFGDIWDRFRLGSIYCTLFFGALAFQFGSVQPGSSVQLGKKRELVDVKARWFGVFYTIGTLTIHLLLVPKLEARLKFHFDVYVHIVLLLILYGFAVYYDCEKLGEALERRDIRAAHTRKTLLWAVDVPFCVGLGMVLVFVIIQKYLRIKYDVIEVFASGALALELTLGNGAVAFISEHLEHSSGPLRVGVTLLDKQRE